MYQSNIKRVQIETNKIIIETEKILENLIETEKNTENKNIDDEKTLSYANLIEHQEMLKNEKQKLDNLEYVVAVVGTMKAGKSMTINAIVGQEVLPSREFPMTTLPTLITHKAKQNVPVLKFKKIDPFEKLVKEIKKKLTNSKTSEHKDLKNLIEAIKNNKISFQKSYEGQEQIESFLKQINDLMRIAKDFEIEPPYDDFTNVDELPRIEVEFYHLSQKENNSNAKLTLLDTPGPDEFKHSSLLKNIFKQQLKRASAVMLLVDYTKMNSQSDVEVKEQVKAVAEMIGRQHLFVLLNKFDQRKRSDDVEEKKAEAKRLISEDILKDKVDPNNIYPISAKSAFYANFGLRELDKNGKIDTSLNWIDDFGVTLMGEDWEDDIDDNERVRKKCKKTWEKSFFEEPLENIISTIHSDALLLVLESSLNTLGGVLKDIEEIYHTNISSLRDKIDELKRKINEIHKDVDKMKKINASINNEAKKKQEAIKTLVDSLLKEAYKSSKEQTSQKLKKKEKQKRDKKLKENKELSLFGFKIYFSRKEINESQRAIKLYEDSKRDKKIIFKTKYDANTFLEDIEKVMNHHFNTVYDTVEKEINEKISTKINELNSFTHDKLYDILQEISKNMGDKIKFKSPVLKFDSGIKNIELDSKEIVKEEKTIELVKQKGFWGSFKRALDFADLRLGYDEVKRNEYVITFISIENQFNRIHKNISDELHEYLETTFEEKIIGPLNIHIGNLLSKIQFLLEQKEKVLKDRENNMIDVEFELDKAEDKLKHIEKLYGRIDNVRNILKAGI